MKKILALLLAVLMLLGLTACGAADEPKDDDADALKVGFIFLHDEQSTYDKNFIEAAKKACEEEGVEMVQKTQIPESELAAEAAKELIEVDGCEIIFADSFGHESFLIPVAKEYPDVQFCHATGTRAHTEGLKNYQNAFASIYQGRYMAGVVAGLKLNEMISANKITAEQAKMGYVGAFPYAEVKSGYTSFYLGAKSVCPSVTMDVKFTQSWYNEQLEQQSAQALIDGGCVLISQHADSLGAPRACENAGVPNVSYNGSTAASAPETFLISSRINWVPYMRYMIACVKNGEDIADDWTGTLENGAVMLTELGKNVAAGTAEKLVEVEAGLKDGSIQVFDTANFTVKGETLTSYKADVDDDGTYSHETEVIENGVFQESKFRSAPYFDIDIDGISLLD